MEITDVEAKILFFLREKLYNQMLLTCADALKKFIGEPSLNLYHAVALHLNKSSDSVREFEALKNENDLQLAAVIALISIQKSQTSDADNLTVLDTPLKDLKRDASAAAYRNAAFVLYCFAKYEKALEYVEKSIKLGGELIEIHALKGWILLELSYLGLNYGEECVRVFEKCVTDSKRHMDFSLGYCEAQIFVKNSQMALDTINKTIVRFPATNIPLIYKGRVLFAQQDFDAADECCNRVLSSDGKNIGALKLQILILLCRDSNYEEAVKLIQILRQCLVEHEPKSSQILADFGSLIARICNKNEKVLNESLKFLEKAVQTENNNVDLITELGYQHYLRKEFKDALKYYKAASKTDSNSFKALLGLTLCEFADKGYSDQIKQQILFLQELGNSDSALLFYLQAKTVDRLEERIQFLEEAFSEQLKPTMSMPYGELYLRILDPDFLLEVLKFYLNFAPKSINKNSGGKPNNIIVNSLNTIKIVTKACPSLEDAQFLLAKVYYHLGDLQEATKILSKIVDSELVEVHLLLAQIHLQNNQLERASQSLELGLSHNFNVRDNPLYHLLLGKIEKAKGNVEDSIKSFNSALSLTQTTANSMAITSKSPRNYEFSISQLSNSDRASIYIELINCYREVNQLHEASKLMDIALEQFHKTPEESKIMILSAQNLVEIGNVQKAIDMLSKVNPNESYYLEARAKLADIFLTHRRDKSAFLECYKEMVQFNMSPESYLLLADAYMTVLEPDKALDACSNALQMNPDDPYLMSKMGKALIDTHYFKRAVDYYKDAIGATGNSQMKMELAELYMNLQDYEDAEKLLNEEINGDGDDASTHEDLVTLQYKTKIYNLLAVVLEKAGRIDAAVEALKKGRNNQMRIRKLLLIEQSALPQEELEILVQFNFKLAEFASNMRENERAVNYYKDALDASPNNLKILGALAKLYMQLNYLDLCQQTCGKLLNLDSDNETASVLMADISFRKIDFDMAVFHFTQLVNKQPTNWTALVRLIEVLRRTGNLDEVPQYLKQAEQFSENGRDLGLHYCIALHQWYTGNLNNALRNFNQARLDADWGSLAIVHMIEICLNPDDEVMGEQFHVDFDDYEYRDSRTMAIKTAERLLKELKQTSFGEAQLKCRLLGNFILLATKEKHNIEKALEDFIAIANQEAYKDQIGPILGVATAYTMLKQAQRAKTQLKRLIKNVWTFEDAEYLERCWLLLADYYVQSGKYDLASDLVKRVLQYNKASFKAYEYSGFVAEKEQKYREAASFYESAWKYNGRSNPSIGYRLAYNLMKCKRYADAIDIAQVILKNNPEYVRIKKDILDKSINNLRT